MLWTSDFLRIAGMRLLHDVLDRPCKTTLRQRTWHTQMLRELVLGLIQTSVFITCSSRVASLMTRSITVSVPCTNPTRKDHRQLWILERFRKLYPGYATNPATWTNTVVTPERLWAGIDDLCRGMRQRRTDIRRRIIPGPGLATRAAARKGPGKKKPSRLKMATSTTTGTNPSPRGNSTQPKRSMTAKRKLTWKPHWLESLTRSTGTCWTPTLLALTWKKSAALTTMRLVTR